MAMTPRATPYEDMELDELEEVYKEFMDERRDFQERYRAFVPYLQAAQQEQALIDASKADPRLTQGIN